MFQYLIHCGKGEPSSTDAYYDGFIDGCIVTKGNTVDVDPCMLGIKENVVDISYVVITSVILEK
jgi:hypothetical protein